MRRPVLAFCLAPMAAPALAMPVSTFLSKFGELEREGALATMTSDARLLKKELQDDAAELHAERLAAAKARSTPAYCPPGGSAQPSLQEIISGLRSIPEAERSRTQVKDALRTYLGQRYPCDR